MNLHAIDILGRRISVLVAVTVAALSASGVENSVAQKSVAFSAFGTEPLYFEANAGQSEGPSQFIARGPQCSVLIAPGEADIILGKPSNKPGIHGQEAGRTVRLELVDANLGAKMSGADRMSARANYFVGNNPANWHADVPLFARVRLDEVYPGVQVIYYANQSAELEYDFRLQAGVNPDQIRFRIEGADYVKIDAAGNLVLKIGDSEIRQHQPVAYQETSAGRNEVRVNYHINQDGTVGFALGNYDHHLPLVIDPTLVPVLDFLTYMGGKKTDLGWAITLGVDGNVYIAGETLSKDLVGTNSIVFLTPQGTNRIFTNFQGGTPSFGDAFVASYDPNGVLRFLTFLGGKKDDGALAIAADSTDGVWITGFTDSTDFPVVNGLTTRTNVSGPNNNAKSTFPADAFIVHLSSSGTTLDSSTYFGGTGLDEGVGIAAKGNQVWITGLTTSPDLLSTNGILNAFQTNLQGDIDAFVAEVTDATNIAYITYLGGTNTDIGMSIAVDSELDAWVTGLTFSTNFPGNINTFTNDDPKFTNHFFSGIDNTNLFKKGRQFHSDGFVSELSPDGSTLLLSSYLGGTNDDSGVHIIVDSSDNVYITGYTLSGDFPTNVATVPTNTDYPNNQIAFPDETTNFDSHVFVMEISGGSILYSTQFGGNSADRGTGIAVDANGNVYVVGSAASTNFFQTNMVVITNAVDPFTFVTNKHGVVTAIPNGFATNNPTFINLSNTNNSVVLKHGGNTNDMFIAELSPGLSNFVHSIILGGRAADDANGAAVESDGSAVYVVGSTTSNTNFATTNAAQFDFGKAKLPNAFVGKILLP